jgi:hypothetical protein
MQRSFARAADAVMRTSVSATIVRSMSVLLRMARGLDSSPGRASESSQIWYDEKHVE